MLMVAGIDMDGRLTRHAYILARWTSTEMNGCVLCITLTAADTYEDIRSTGTDQGSTYEQPGEFNSVWTEFHMNWHAAGAGHRCRSSRASHQASAKMQRWVVGSNWLLGVDVR